MKISKPFVSLGLVICVSVTSGCNKGSGSGVGLQSRGYNLAAADALPAPLHWFQNLVVPAAMAGGSSITGLKLCVREMKIEAEGGSSIRNGDSELFEARLGMVNLGDGNTSVSWGSLPIPDSTAVKRTKIEIHKDPELCGSQYSAIVTTSAGEVNLTKDIELKFAFSAVRTLNKGDTVTVSLANFIAQLDAANQAGQLNDSQITHYLEQYSSGPDDSAD